MPALRNAKHERFAQALAKGKPAVEAYKEAGYGGKWADKNAHRLTENEGIQRRVRELQDVGAKRAEVTIDGHLRKLEEMRVKAIEAGQISAAVRAEELQGKVSGFYVERHEVEQHTVVESEPLEASESDWESEFASSEQRTH